MHSDSSNAAGEVYRIHVAPDQSGQALVEDIIRHTSGRRQPALLILPTRQVAAFRRPDDFLPFKHLKRQLGVPIFFVIPGGPAMRSWAERCGLAVYASQEEYLHTQEQGLPTGATTLVTEAEPHISIPPERKLLTRPILSQNTIPLRGVDALPYDASATASPATVPFLKRPRVQLALGGLVVLCVAASVGTLIVLKRLQPQAEAGSVPLSSSLVGYVYFQSSGQFNQQGNEGLNDGLQIDLQHMASPVPGKSYHAWLLGDASMGEEKAIYLGQLTVAHGDAHSIYTDPTHLNLLTVGSRFLVTENDSSNVPGFPFDTSTWRYAGSISQAPDPRDTVNHFSLLDHLRHLLASEPSLNRIGLQGGLDTWFYRNTAKLLEWTFSARDDWASGATDFMRRQIIRTLDYLDGVNEVSIDVPAGTPFLGDTTINRVGLLELDAGRGPTPGLIYQLDRHLVGLVASPGRSMEQQTLASQILAALNQAQFWLQQVRQIAGQLFAMDDTQLLSQKAHGLLNDLATDANNVYAGTTDPATGYVQPCALWAVTTMQRLASIPITLYRA